jgi:hypothetical protein
MSYSSDESDCDDNYSPAVNIVMTLDGVMAKDINKLQNAKNYSLCEICDKYYEKDMIDPSNDGFVKCVHCWFFLKYEDFTKNEVTSFEKETLLNYINTNNAKHNSTTCTKKSDTGGCFLCEYKKGIVPECLLELIQSKENKIIPVKKTVAKNDTVHDHHIKFENDEPTSCTTFGKIKPGEKITLIM